MNLLKVDGYNKVFFYYVDNGDMVRTQVTYLGKTEDCKCMIAVDGEPLEVDINELEFFN